MHVGGHIQEPVGSLLDVSNSLTELGKQHLATALQVLRVEYDPGQLPAGEPSREQVARPLGKLVTGVEGHARDGDGRLVVRERFFHARRGGWRLDRGRRQP